MSALHRELEHERPEIPVSASLRAAKQGKQCHRPRSHLKLSGRAESGIRRRLARLGALAPDSRVTPQTGRKSEARRSLLPLMSTVSFASGYFPTYV